MEKKELKVMPYFSNLAMNFNLEAIVLDVNWNGKVKSFFQIVFSFTIRICPLHVRGIE